MLDLAVGAERDSDGGTNRGAVYILFLTTSGTVSSYQKISNTVGAFTATLGDGDQFGNAITPIGDLNGNGVLDMAVGAPYDDDGGDARGALYILHLTSTGGSCVPYSGGSGDPHLILANGGDADFRGSHRDYYAFISSPGYHFAPHFQEVDFWFNTATGLKQLVHGTFMTKAVWRVRTSAGKELIVMADALKRAELVVYDVSTVSITNLKQWQSLAFDDVHIETRQLTMSVESPAWQVNVTSKPIYGLVRPLLNETHVHGHWDEEQRRLDIVIHGAFPQPDAHGIIGQSYRDSTVRHGKLDAYGIANYTTVAETVNADGMLPPMTTSAQAEGAIEGVYTDYKLPNTFSTDFKFSRYALTPRTPVPPVTKRTASTVEWDGIKKWEGKKREL